MPEKGDIADWIEQVELTPDQRVKQLEKTAKLITPQPQNQPLELPDKNVRAKDNKAIKIAMERDRARQVIGNQLRFNERTREIELFSEELGIKGERFYLDFLEDDISEYFGITIDAKDKTVEGIIRKLAKENAYDPVRDYLDQCAQQYSDTKILDNLAENLLGTDEPIHQIIFKKTLVGAVARVYDPGCKCESVTILQSPRQGINKSRTWETLFGREYFCDNVGDISNKDEVAKLHRVWGCEWSEFESITSKKDVGKIKSFLSTSVDLIREPYGRKCEPIPRRAIIVGTTNTDDFLRDDTGSRRFNIIEVNKPEIDIDWLKEHRDQIWAAAVHLYRQGEIWWLTASEQKQSNEINEDFRDELPLEQEILNLLSDKNEVTIDWILKNIQSVDTTRVNDQATISRIITKVLKRERWSRTRLSENGKRPRAWRRPNTDPLHTSDPPLGDPLEKEVDHLKNPSSKAIQDTDPPDPLKINVSQKPNISNTQPSPEPIQTQIQKSLYETLLEGVRFSQKEFFSRFPDNPEEVETFLKKIEGIGRIYRKDGYIHPMSKPKLDPKDRVAIVGGQFKGRYGSVEKYNGLNKSQIHTYIVLMDLGYKTEPLILPENELKRI
ncbi:virulence-associated E family protein [Limnoraphis robusta]|nr:virulence-associated E family protein [Limnoraphis robusta]